MWWGAEHCRKHCGHTMRGDLALGGNQPGLVESVLGVVKPHGCPAALGCGEFDPVQSSGGVAALLY